MNSVDLDKIDKPTLIGLVNKEKEKKVEECKCWVIYEKCQHCWISPYDGT